MGYTHYFTVKEPFKLTDEDVKELKTLYKEHSNIKIRWEYDSTSSPTVADTFIRFNGVGEKGHETFSLDLNVPTWRFCKTARKPYDLLVSMTLLFLKENYPNQFDFSSDGDMSDPEWQKAVSEMERHGYDRKLLESFLK